jgi:hypothetical protein
MLDNVFSFFEKLVLDFTWTRFTFLLSALILVVAGVASFELYTGHFRLDKLERETHILEQLVEVAKKVDAIPVTDPGKAAFERILHQLDQDIARPPLTLGTIPTLTSKVIYGVLPWLFLALLVLLTTSTGRGTAMMGMAVFAIPLVILGANLPTFQAEWINNFGYPWGSMLVVIVGIIYIQRRRASQRN